MDDNNVKQFDDLAQDIKTDLQKQERISRLKQEIEAALSKPLLDWVVDSEQNGPIGKGTLDKVSELCKLIGSNNDEAKDLDRRIKGRTMQVRGARIERGSYPKQTDGPVSEPLIELLFKGYFWSMFSVLIVTGFLSFFVLPLPFAQRTQLFVLFVGSYPILAMFTIAVVQIMAIKSHKWQTEKFFVWFPSITVYGVMINTVALGFAQITLLRNPPLSIEYNPLPLYDGLILPIVITSMITGFFSSFIESR